jgi:co-chaperonin GroES (HSP10)
MEVLKRNAGWRTDKGAQAGNVSGLRVTGHRVLVINEEIEKTTASGIVLTSKTVDQEKAANVFARVIEIGHDAWTDKSTDYCAVGDKVLVGKYCGSMVKSPVDDKEYRLLSDLDVICVVEE